MNTHFMYGRAVPDRTMLLLWSHAALSTLNHVMPNNKGKP